MTSQTKPSRALRSCLAVTTGIVALAAALPAAAQTAPPEDPEVSALDEIVVTAQRRGENMQSVPIAVSAVTSERLQNRGVTSTTDLGAAIPSLTVFATAGYVQPRVRGIGNTVFGAGFESGVATYVDGVYLASAPASVFTLNNIERVEVLKGPQGTLFGRNATGGLIQIITREPKDTPSAMVSVTAANYETFGADGYVTGPLADGLAADLGLHVSTQGVGYGVNLFDGREVNRTDEEVNLRGSLLWRPREGSKLRLTADYERTEGDMYAATRLAPGTGFFLPQPTIDRAWDINSDVRPFLAIEGGGVALHAEQDLGFASLSSITAYRKSTYHTIFDADVTDAPLVALDVLQRDHQFSQELQLTSSADSTVKWVAGVFYFNSEGSYDPSVTAFSGPARPATPVGPLSAVTTFSQLGTESLAGYAQATAPLGEATNLTLGYRYSTEERTIDATQVNDFALIPVPVPGAPIPSQSKRFSQPTWRVAVDHRFSPEVFVYATYNRGFKSGGYNGQFPVDAAFDPEQLDAYEVGTKLDLFERRLRINAASFFYAYDDIQVQKFVGSQPSFYNGASAEVYGLDADIEARVTSQLTLSGGFTWLHDRFTDFPNAIISTQVPTGIVITTGSATGNRLPNTADFSATLAAEYVTTLSFAELGLDASYTYNDGYFTQPDNILEQPAYHLLAAGVRLEFPNGVTARLWGRNLANEEIYTALTAGTFASNASFQAPRTYGLTLTARF